MIITLAVVTGFKKEITNRAVGFGSHIQIINKEALNSFETAPIPASLGFLPEIKQIKGIRQVQPFAMKPGIIKAGKDNQGVIVKGVDSTYDWNFFSNNLIEGRLINYADTGRAKEVLISTRLAAMLNQKVGDEFLIYFYQDRTRSRRCKIAGLFQTSFENFDKQFIFMNMKEIQRLYGWSRDSISGYEILVDDFKHLEQVASDVFDIAGLRYLDNGTQLEVITVKDLYNQIFNWLSLLDMNVKVILILMIIVAVVNMISGLIILILDRTQTIGLLKAIGTQNRKIKRIFLYQAVFLILKGLLIGNALALAVCYIQDTFRLFKLDPGSYFIDYVPVNLSLPVILFTNLASLILIFLAMYMPALIISRVDPVKTLRYE